MPEVPQSLAWKDIATWLFCGGWSAIGLFVASKISSMSGSVEKLNVNVAVVIEKVGNHDKMIERHDDRIGRLEVTDRTGNYDRRIERLEESDA